MENLLSVTEETGKYGEVRELRGGPVPKEEVIRNIQASAAFNVPVMLKKPKREGTMIFVAGGPSLAGLVGEIKKRKEAGDFVVTSNNTHDYLIDNGITPDICIVIDPKEIVREYIKKPSLETLYVIAVVCNPDVFKRLIDAGQRVEKLLIGYGMDDNSDVAEQNKLYPQCNATHYLVGGTMMGLRAMPFAFMLGFKKLDYYGFDSSFGSNPKLVKSTDPEYDNVINYSNGRHYKDMETGTEYTIDDKDGGFFYAYGKKRQEDIQLAKTMDGRQFITSPCFAHQAIQFIKWVDRMEGKLEVTLFGDSLSSHMLKLHREEMAKLKEDIGDKRWTDYYANQQKMLHEKNEYGVRDDAHFETLGRMIVGLFSQLKRPLRILDYGCGSGKLKEILEQVFKCIEVVNYDPHVERFSKDPEGTFDLVCCFDVMEHIEIQCVPNVLKHIASKMGLVGIFAIATEDAVKKLPDGRNAHITQRSPLWWRNTLQEHMVVSESAAAEHGVIFSTQVADAKQRIEAEISERGK